jgi:quercetin dioxygenase-like cupin family protein
MNVRSAIIAGCLAVATSAAAQSRGEVVTPNFEHAIPNIPGKSPIAVVVDYAPGGASPSHTHAKSAFIYGYVSGVIVSQVNDGPEPAKLLAVFVVDTDDKALTTPDK